MNFPVKKVERWRVRSHLLQAENAYVLTKHLISCSDCVYSSCSIRGSDKRILKYVGYWLLSFAKFSFREMNSYYNQSLWQLVCNPGCLRHKWSRVFQLWEESTLLSYPKWKPFKLERQQQPPQKPFFRSLLESIPDGKEGSKGSCFSSKCTISPCPWQPHWMERGVRSERVTRNPYFSDLNGQIRPLAVTIHRWNWPENTESLLNFRGKYASKEISNTT